MYTLGGHRLPLVMASEKEDGMREISLKKRLEVLALYLQGLPYDNVVAKMGVSKGSVVTIVDELRAGRIPSLKDLREVADELRELAVRLRKTGLNVTEAALGLTFFQQLVGLGIEPQLVPQWAKMCQEILPDESKRKDVLNAAVRLVKAEEDTGVTYDELPAQCEAKVTELKQLEGKIAALKTEEEKARAAATEADKALAEKHRFVDAEKRRLDGELRQLLSEHRLTLDNVEFVAKLFSEELKGEGVGEKDIEAIRCEVKVVGNLQNTVFDLEFKKGFVGGEIEALDEEKARLEAEVSSYRQLVDRLKRRADRLWPVRGSENLSDAVDSFTNTLEIVIPGERWEKYRDKVTRNFVARADTLCRDAELLFNFLLEQLMTSRQAQQMVRILGRSWRIGQPLAEAY